MELELELKITRHTDDQSSTDFHIAKDRTGPVFVSTETDSVFILSAHLKGIEEENIKININEDGTRLTIRGEKLVTETIMRGWKVYKKEKEVKGFRKTFKIPDGVVLDRIKAKFGAEKSSLTIYMPKYEKEIRGHGIEEVKEQEDEGEKGAMRSEDTKPKGHEKEELMKPAEMKHEEDERVRKVDKDEMPPLKKLKKQPHEIKGEVEEAKETQESPKMKQQAQEPKPSADVQGSVSAEKPVPGIQGVQEHQNGEAAQHQMERAENSLDKEGDGAVVEKKPSFFAPSFFMGSALITSLVVLVVGLVRTKRQ